MVKPASKPMPTCTELSARTTGTPRPPAPTSAAITTIDRLSMMHWVMPAMMVEAAPGNSTLKSNCIGVAPKAWPASSSGFGTDEMPRCVSRIGAGSANITVDMRPGTTPKPKPRAERTTVAEAKPKLDLRKSDTKPEPQPQQQQQVAAKPNPAPQREANAAAATMDGAQRVVPAGNFDSRWGGLQ